MWYPGKSRVAALATRAVLRARSDGVVDYVAVVNGADLWMRARVSGDARGVELALVNRRDRGRVRSLRDARRPAVHGEHGVTVQCRRADVLTERDVGIWDVVTLRPGRAPKPLRAADRVEIYPAPPTAPMPGDDGVRVTPYVTRDGRAAMRVDLAPPSAEVIAVISEPGRLAFTLELKSWTGSPPAEAVLAQRGGEGSVRVPLVLTGQRAKVTIPLEAVAEQCSDGGASVWNVSVEGPDGAVRCGRTAHDVADPRRAYRYATASFQSRRPDGVAVTFRPYFTRDRYLAVEIDCSRTGVHG